MENLGGSCFEVSVDAFLFSIANVVFKAYFYTLPICQVQGQMRT